MSFIDSENFTITAKRTLSNLHASLVKESYIGEIRLWNKKKCTITITSNIHRLTKNDAIKDAESIFLDIERMGYIPIDESYRVNYHQ